MSVALQMKTAIIDPVNCNLKGAYFIIFLLANKHQLTHTQFACFILNASMSTILSMQNTYVTDECVSVSLNHVCLCVAEQQATCVCLLPATETLIDRCIRDSHILGESFNIYDVTLSVVISSELAHIWRLLSDVSGENHGSNWEGFDRSVVVESDSRANWFF